MREDSGPVCSLGGGEDTSTLWDGVGGLLPQAQKFTNVWDVLVFRDLPAGLPGTCVRDAGFPKRTFNAYGPGLLWWSIQCLLMFSHSCRILSQCLSTA